MQQSHLKKALKTFSSALFHVLFILWAWQAYKKQGTIKQEIVTKR
ncbi:hypothetical protein SD77_4068 [Bacillus badius]|uniref:Mobile element protein n=1 Tax=Bacillus badius TaxID=1455 RepID=A0ABR5AUH8_BACBA|nr:hypothetical protein SD78_0374 [Bacillus badius]KIL78388.1 hypothetical protein SD77_4068 [Bacillus badius]